MTDLCRDEKKIVLLQANSGKSSSVKCSMVTMYQFVSIFVQSVVANCIFHASFFFVNFFKEKENSVLLLIIERKEVKEKGETK